MMPKIKYRRLMMLLTAAALMVFAVSAASAQEDTSAEPARPAPPSWEAPPDGVVPPEPPADGEFPPDLPADGELPPRPPRPRPVYTETTTVTCAPSTRLAGETQGEVAQSYSSIRESIGSSTVLATMPGGAVFAILDGPVCSGPHYWYQVSYNGVVGWVAEGNLGNYWLEPVSLD